MRLLELFAGGGGAALGLEAAGFFHHACLERDPLACQTLRLNGFQPLEMDIDQAWGATGSSKVSQYDAVWASWPCQPFSSAGKRDLTDKRNLWPHTFRAVEALKPRWFMGENVPGLLQHKEGCAKGCLGPEQCPRAFFDRVIIHQLQSQFAFVSWRVLNASSFGVPQHRRRVFVVAGPRPIEWPRPTHGKPTTQGDLFGRELLPWRTAGEALGLTGLFYTGSIADGKQERVLPPGPAPTLTAHVGHSSPWLCAGTPFLRTEMTSAKASPVDEPAGVVPTSGNQYLHADDPGVRVSGEEVSILRRRLTVEECAILQGFPPCHLFYGGPSSVYRQIGNAVPPKLAEVVGLAVMEAEIDQSLDLVKGEGLVCSSRGC
jgi:DNA (cytosine-5)-methyltransferase 1